MATSKFYHWLRYQKHREDEVGDLARDAFWNPDTPKDSDDPDVWRKYCKSCPHPFLLTGFEQAWEEFGGRKGAD